jgi:hypothetical protein
MEPATGEAFMILQVTKEVWKAVKDILIFKISLKFSAQNLNDEMTYGGNQVVGNVLAEVFAFLKEGKMIVFSMSLLN